MSSSDESFSQIIQMQKMLFIFNAILSGWCVKMVEPNKFEFKKDRRNQEVNLDDYLQKFVMKNLNIDTIYEKKKNK